MGVMGLVLIIPTGQGMETIVPLVSMPSLTPVYLSHFILTFSLRLLSHVPRREPREHNGNYHHWRQSVCEMCVVSYLASWSALLSLMNDIN